ncbi:MAG: hypothetical protein QG563_435, partial [Patescibacteria group bacterium]|nr:hypothetical protein [Patescibacteria group bacterium]
MTALIIIFSFSLLGSFLILARKSYQIEHGHIEDPELKERSILPPVTVANIRRNTQHLIKTRSHKLFLWLAKWWAIFTHIVSKFISQKLLEEGYIKSSPTLSTFLKSVGEYKNRVRKVRERLEAHDRAKELME